MGLARMIAFLRMMGQLLAALVEKCTISDSLVTVQIFLTEYGMKLAVLGAQKPLFCMILSPFLKQMYIHWLVAFKRKLKVSKNLPRGNLILASSSQPCEPLQLLCSIFPPQKVTTLFFSLASLISLILWLRLPTAFLIVSVSLISLFLLSKTTSQTGLRNAELTLTLISKKLSSPINFVAKAAVISGFDLCKALIRVLAPITSSLISLTTNQILLMSSIAAMLTFRSARTSTQTSKPSILKSCDGLAVYIS